jgi:glycosyltransferase involved in cell wall biosynthesis
VQLDNAVARDSVMRTVGIDAHVLQGKFQGSRTFVENILTEIGRLRSRHRFVVFSHDAEETSAKLPFANFEHVTLPVKSAIGRLLAYWPLAERRYGLDSLLTQYIAPPLARSKQLVVVHDILFETHPEFFPRAMCLRNRLLVRASVRRASIVFVPSAYTAQQVVRVYGIPADRVILTPIGFRKQGRDEQLPEPLPTKPYILAVGRIEPRKNLIQLGIAFSRLERSDTGLVVVGRPDFGFAETMSFFARLPRLTHFTEVSEEALAWLYRNAAVFVQPSLGEGFGIPLLEALAAGTPVITSNRTALPEVGGDLVRYFDPTRPQATDHLRDLIEEVIATRPRLSDELVERHLARFEWQRSAERLLEAIDAL